MFKTVFFPTLACYDIVALNMQSDYFVCVHKKPYFRLIFFYELLLKTVDPFSGAN